MVGGRTKCRSEAHTFGRNTMNPVAGWLALALVAACVPPARTPFVLLVNPALPVHSVDDFVKLARAKPLSFGAPGPATFHRLQAELFKTMFGLDFVYVPYKGSAPALTDLAGGHIDFMFAD